MDEGRDQSDLDEPVTLNYAGKVERSVDAPLWFKVIVTMASVVLFFVAMMAVIGAVMAK